MCMCEQALPLAVSAGKFFWFLLFQFLTLDYFTHVGIMSANLSPSLQIATTVVLTLVPTWNVLSGFYVPKSVSSVHKQPKACAAYLVWPRLAAVCIHKASKDIWYALVMDTFMHACVQQRWMPLPRVLTCSPC